jgi:dephospho-CoA kinase
MPAVFAGKPVIGIVGGIGSGKSFVADLFGELGCRVINADELVTQVYQDPEVLRTIAQWWGAEVLTPAGQANRPAIAARVFSEAAERRRLEGLIHPRVSQLRDRLMQESPGDILGFVWDAPLLFEAALDRQCDAIVFVEASESHRLQRVAARGWTAEELSRREKSQLPLDKKRALSHYVVENTADAAFARRQVEEVLSRILRPA